MLLTLRLRFADRPDYELAFESDRHDGDPWAALRAQADRDGRIPLGDRDSCRIDEVIAVSFVEPSPVRGPNWRGDLRDEDVATALDENYDAL